MPDTCSECEKPLTDPVSKKLGIGPKCWLKKYGTAHPAPHAAAPTLTRLVDPNQIPLPLETPVSDAFEITMEYTRTMTFNVKAASAFEAYSQTASAFMYDDLHPDDEGLSELELTHVKFGDRGIRIVSSYDFNAPKVNGLSPRKHVAYEGATRLGESGDLEALLAEHLTVQEGPAA